MSKLETLIAVAVIESKCIFTGFSLYFTSYINTHATLCGTGMYVPPFLLYQQTYVPKMCTKTLNEKPVDMSTGTGREPVGLQLSPRLSWANS